MRIINMLLEITVYSAVIFGILYLIKLCLGKKLSPALHYALWFVLVARLMLPITIDSGFHLFTLPAPAPAVSAPVAETVPQQLDDALAFGAMLPPTVQPDTTDGAMPAQTAPAASAPQTAKRLTTAQIMLLVWMVGVGACAVWLTVLYASLLYRIKRNRAKPSKKLMALLEEVKAELGIRSRIRLICLYEYGTPALMFPNVILMPVDALAAMNTEQVKLALRHELTHYQRGDQFTGLLLSLLQAVYWFNPVTWIGFCMMRADMETACDAMVTRRFSRTEKNEYASLILNLFAQPTHRQIVLGMAQPSTRKLAEQRIRGIFMRRSSKPLAKAVCIMMVLVMAVGCFTTACVPAANDKSVSIIGGADGPTAIYVAEQSETAAPETTNLLSYSKAFYDGKLTVNINASTSLPAESVYGVYRMADAPFTQEQVDNIVDVLMQGKPLVTVDGFITKEMALTLLEEAKSTLAKLEAGESVAADGDLSTVEGARAAVEQYQKWYEETPETLASAPATTESYSEKQSLLVHADLGQERLAEIEIRDFEPNCLYFSNGREFLLDGYRDDDQLPQGVSVTRDEAIALAQKTLADLDVNYMELAFAGRSSRADGSEYDIDSEAYRNTQCHLLIYTRTINGVPMIADDTIAMMSGPSGEKNINKYFERIYFAIDDTGIRQLEWRGKKELKEEVTMDTSLLPLDMLPEHIGAAIEKKYSYVLDTNRAVPYQSIAIDIDRMALGYVSCITEDGSYLIKPMWDCFGTVDARFDPEAVTAYNLENDSSLQAQMVNSNPRNAICTVDAETGEPYDKRAGIYANTIQP